MEIIRSPETKTFIEKAEKKHGSTYNYSKVVYVNAHKKVTIGCEKHGDFEQSPNGHLNGRGCKKCGAMLLGLKKRQKASREFKRRARKKHGDKYDYSKVVYINNHTLVTIICPDHGEFKQQPNNHLQGKKCQKCAGTYKPTTHDFIQRAIEIHGDFYDYSKSVYIDCKTKLTIICPIHGSFKQTPSNHYNGGCIKCGKERVAQVLSYKTEEFIEKAKEKHGDTYDYSNTIYTNSKEYVNIRCKEHGVFTQTAGAHLAGNGCAICSGYYKRTTDEFIQEAKQIHGDAYDYSKVDYKTRHDHVTIICPKKGHGSFLQQPDSHINGKCGCPKCHYEKTSLRMSYTQEEFLKKAFEIHGDTFDYSKVEYINSQTYITIICHIHGEFKQVPSSHLQGCGCIKCSGTYQRDTDDFKKRAFEIHGDKYDYSKVEYINCHVKVIIGCKTHGDFEQTPSDHLVGSGCIECGGCAPLNLETVIERFRTTHGELYGYSKCEYVNCSTNMTIICEKHGEFQQSYDNHWRGQGCPHCNTKTEFKLYEFLKIAHPKTVHQFKVEWCKKKRFLPYDFCIPDLKIIIELDGAQHFKQVQNWMSPEETLENDHYKERCATDNEYNVIRLLQEDVWNDRYDWKAKLTSVIEDVKNDNQSINVIYICENDEYDNHITL